MKNFDMKALPLSAIKARAKRGRGTSAPMKEELALYSKYMGTIKGKNVLVLGATPELRDLAIQKGAICTAVDINPQIMLSQTSIMQKRNVKRNFFIVGDWLKLDKMFKRGHFDIVVGDAPLNNIPAQHYVRLLKILKNILKEDGAFINRQMAPNRQKYRCSFKEMQERYGAEKITPLGIFLEYGYMTPLFKEGYNPRNHAYVWANVCKKIMEKTRPFLKEKDREDLWNLITYAKVHTTSLYLRQEYDSIVRNVFKIKEVGILKDYPFTRNIPMYFLKNS